MHGSTRSRTIERPIVGIRAAVWIESGRALVLRGDEGSDVTRLEVAIPGLAAAIPPALAQIAHVIGDADRVLVLGRDDLRTALEREIVAIGHRPEIIRDEGPGGVIDETTLLLRLAHLR